MKRNSSYKGRLIGLMLCASVGTVYGQLQQEINEQVWKPFIAAFNAQDTEAFAAVHSRDFVRVLRDSDQIYGYEEAFVPVPDSIREARAVWQRQLDLRFTKRIADNDKAFEMGYYRTAYRNTATGEESTSYGQFHVLLRKEEGMWKVVMDADGHDEVDESVFMSASPMQ